MAVEKIYEDLSRYAVQRRVEYGLQDSRRGITSAIGVDEAMEALAKLGIQGLLDGLDDGRLLIVGPDGVLAPQPTSLPVTDVNDRQFECRRLGDTAGRVPDHDVGAGHGCRISRPEMRAHKDVGVARPGRLDFRDHRVGT